jgi:squalene-hopene/tetraprenyl-beta-curcumene cyclase
MNMILSGSLVFLSLSLSQLLGCAAPAMASHTLQDTATPRKKGTIYKDEVDRLVGVVRDTARAQSLPSLGGSVLATAKILTAMARCHRRYYYPNDVPCVTSSVGFLIKSRKSDGSFGDAETTAWVVDALTSIVLEPEQFHAEVEQAQGWLETKKATVATFQALTSAVLAQVRADVFPQHLAKAAAEQSATWFGNPAGLDRAAAADALVQLVACQVANKLLDNGQDPQAAAATFSKAQQKAVEWLLSQQKDGVFSITHEGKPVPEPGLTGFMLLALQTKPKSMRTADEQAVIEKGIKWLLGCQNEDGTWGQQTPNYVTCVVVAALTRREDPAHKQALDKAQRAILGFQNCETGGYKSSDRDYGSIGYGNSQRGDLSNLHFSLEALRATGLPADNDAFKKAIVFLQRTQNLKSVNDFSGKVPDPDREGVVLDATSGDDGGASYYPGNSNAGYDVLPDGKSVPRSYGSMTYALLKAYTLAGLKGTDPRVQAAVKWIQDNWTLAVNPGADPKMGEKVQYQGLFYYYMVLAQALDLAGVQTVKVPAKVAGSDGKAVPATEVNWRKALRAHLEGMQAPDGTWLNTKNGRWYEDKALLCTCYAMVALEQCR